MFPSLYSAILSLCAHVVEDVRDLFGVPFIRVPISFMRVLIILSEAPPLYTLTLRTRFQHTNFGGYYIQSRAKFIVLK